jgi:hypothetical protein
VNAVARKAAGRMPGLLVALMACLLLRTVCVAPPVTSYHEDLPAYAPDWGPPESRFGYHRAFWNDSTLWRPAIYFNLGLRDGQRVHRVAFEEGLIANVFDTGLGLGPEIGIGLSRPVVMVRGSWEPFTVGGSYSTNRLVAGFDAKRWWQVTALYGTDYRPHGLGWSAGARAAKLGVGPVVGAEFGSGMLSLRAELSASFKAPWDKSSSKGWFLTVGVGAAHHGHQPDAVR